MIYTCTLNPSIDYHVELEGVILGSLNRAKHTSFLPGGKGINVSRVLKRLGKDNVALGFTGGFTGEFIKDYLSIEGINHEFIQHEDPTRINMKVKTNTETEINGSGAFISEQNQQALYKQVSHLLPTDYFVLAGSFPPSISIEFYKSIIALCDQNGIPFVVDVSGSALKEVLPYKPFLIKPNQHELGELVGASILTKEDAIHYGKKLLDMGPQNIMVSLGGDGAVFMNRELTATATVPKGEVRNTVGAGDSTVAGFLTSIVNGATFIEAFQYGVASGTATAFSTDLCQKQEVDQLLSQIRIDIL